MRARAVAVGALLLALQASHAQSQTTAPVTPPPQSPPSPPPLVVSGDAIEQPLTPTPGDPTRGRAIVANRQVGLCLLCHTGPIPEERFQGNLAPDLSGAGTRWTAGQLRLRIADPLRINPESIMPAYYRTDHLTRVGPAWRGKTLLTPQQIEDVVAWLQTLRN